MPQVTLSNNSSISIDNDIIFRGVLVNPRGFNIATLFFVEVNISPHPSIVPSLSEIRELSIITPCLVLSWTHS